MKREPRLSAGLPLVRSCFLSSLRQAAEQSADHADDRHDDAAASWHHAPVRHLVDPRLQGERARHAVYDLVVLLSVLVALQQSSTPAHRVGAYLVLTLLGVAFAEIYAGFVARTLTDRRTPTRAETMDVLGEVLGGLVLAGIPLLWLLLAAVGVVARDTALEAALWTGLVLLTLYAVVGARAARLTLGQSMAWGLSVGLVGLMLVTIKALLH